MRRNDTRFPRYVRLLRLYPQTYRQRYEQEMLQTTADMLDDAATRQQKLAVWARIALDLPMSIMKQQLLYAGGIMQHQMPSYIKRNGIIASILLVPFFASLMANGVDRALNHQDLYGTWFWHSWVLASFFLWFPELALLLLIGSYVYFVAKHGDQSPWLKKLFDIRRSWPLIIPGLLACGILFIIAFHDSGQCLRHSPSYLTGHISQTWQCMAPSSKLVHKALP